MLIESDRTLNVREFKPVFEERVRKITVFITNSSLLIGYQRRVFRYAITLPAQNTVLSYAECLLSCKDCPN